MTVHKIKKGLDLPIRGKPAQQISDGPTVSRVAVMADDFPGMKPGFEVEVGDAVRRGQVLFKDRRRGEVQHTSPAAGTVVAIHRGARRALLSVVVELNQAERDGRPSDEDFQSFAAYAVGDPSSLSAEQVRAPCCGTQRVKCFHTIHLPQRVGRKPANLGIGVFHERIA